MDAQGLTSSQRKLVMWYANDTRQSMKVILYFAEAEHASVLRILKELELENDNNIILIDACDNKESASNVK